MRGWIIVIDINEVTLLLAAFIDKFYASVDVNVALAAFELYVYNSEWLKALHALLLARSDQCQQFCEERLSAGEFTETDMVEVACAHLKRSA